MQKQFEEVGLEGWLENWDIKNIYSEVASLAPGEIYVEVGVAHGKSLAVANLAAYPGVQLYGVDEINWSDREDKINKFLSFYNKTSTHTFIEGDSQNTARFWRKGFISTLFIDGDHSYMGTLKDIASWLPLVEHGGTIMFDDYNDKEEVKQAVIDILKDGTAYTDHRIDGEMYICKKL